jgi:hypothetical protein
VSPASTTWAEVRARRVERSFLAERASAERLVDVVRELGGVQAQLQASAELQLAARVDGITAADVKDALWKKRKLVKAWTLRGTLHLHPAAELSGLHGARRVLAADAPPEPSIVGPWRDPEGAVHPPLAAEQVAAIEAAVHAVLDGRCLTREEIADEVVQRVGEDPRERLRSGFGFFLGDLCQGPPRGQKVTFVRPDEWVEPWRDADGEAAILEACRRFLWACGPSRPAEFREWFMPRLLSAGRARGVFEALSGELEEIDVEGRTAWVRAGDTSFPEPAPHVCLLPEYDAYVLGFREREHLVPVRVKDLIARGRGRYEGVTGTRVLLVDGVVAGTWSRRRLGKKVELDVTPVGRLTRAQRTALTSEAERIGVFLGLEPVLRITP